MMIRTTCGGLCGPGRFGGPGEVGLATSGYAREGGDPV